LGGQNRKRAACAILNGKTGPTGGECELIGKTDCTTPKRTQKLIKPENRGEEGKGSSSKPLDTPRRHPLQRKESQKGWARIHNCGGTAAGETASKKSSNTSNQSLGWGLTGKRAKQALVSLRTSGSDVETQKNVQNTQTRGSLGHKRKGGKQPKKRKRPDQL